MRLIDEVGVVICKAWKVKYAAPSVSIWAKQNKCVICVMMTENIDHRSGQKDVSSQEGTTLKKTFYII